MNRLHHHPRQSIWLRLYILLAVLAALASVRPAQATTPIRLVKDINTTGASSIDYNADFTAMGDTLFFVANDGVYGAQLWASDGTETGTIVIGGGAGGLTIVGSQLFFTTGYTLWKSDGSIAGTTSLIAFPMECDYHLLCNNPPYALTAMGNTLFFVVQDINFVYQLWKSDGTSAGTTLVKAILPTDLTVVGNTLFFSADDGVHGTELWKSDGSTSGTTLVKDISPSGSSTPSDLTAIGNTIYFVADNGVHGRELWKSDGSPAGTIMVKDITLNGSSDPVYLTAVGSTLFFSADDGVQGRDLWKSDGTTAGTIAILTNVAIDSPVAAGNLLFFLGQMGLWKSDGSTTGTIPIVVFPIYCDEYPNPCASPSDLTALGSRLFFAAEDSGMHGIEPWTSDGTPSGTMQIQDLNPGAVSSYPGNFTRLGTTVFFSAQTPTTGLELWAMDWPHYMRYLPLTRR